MSKVLYFLGLAQLWPFLLFFKTKTYYEDDNRKNKRIKGSAIIISNHRSYMDGIVIALSFFFKRLYYLVVDFYFSNGKRKILKFIVKITGGIFVNQDGGRQHDGGRHTDGCDFGFIEKSKRVTARGGVVLIFPEGDFTFTYEPSKFTAGYIMLAVKTGARIVPVVNDFNYGFFKRVHIMIGNGIDLSNYSCAELTREKLNEMNNEISNKYLTLFYRLKRKKAERFSDKYDFISPRKGDVIRIFVGSHYHYGVYISAGEVIQFGLSVNRAGEDVLVNSVSLKDFCGAKIPEVRVLKRSEKRFVRDSGDIEKYAKSCLGRGGYSLADNNCLDFANRVTLKI